MARQNINIGTSLNDGTGDKLRDAIKKINDNFIDLYASSLSSGNIHIENAIISTTNVSTPDLVLAPTSQGWVNVAYGMRINTSSSNVTFDVWANDTYTNSIPAFRVNAQSKTTTINGTLSAANANITGNTILSGNVNIGSSPTNIISLQSRVQGDIVPVQDNVRYIGQPDRKYFAGFFGNVVADTISSTASTITNSNVSILRVSEDSFLGDLLIRENMISNRIPNEDIDLRPDGTGNVRVSTRLIVGTSGDTGVKTTIYGDLVVNGNAIIQNRTIASSVGASGDTAGMVTIDNNYIYRCIANYDGSTSIWKRVALSATPW